MKPRRFSGTRCKSWQRGDPQRLLRQLVVRGLLAEKLVVTNDIASAYLVLGPNVDKLMSGNLRIVFPMKCDKKASLVAAAAAPAAGEDKPITALIKRIEERCYADLVEACREMGAARGASLAAVLPQAALKAMAARLPESPDDMLALPHVTRANYDKYGADLLKITSAYAVEKMGLLMQYQDELEEETKPAEDFEDDSGEDSDTDWASLGRRADTSVTSSSQRGRKTYRGSVRKRYRRKGTSSAKKKAYRGSYTRGRGSSGAATSRGGASTSRGAASTGRGGASGGTKLARTAATKPPSKLGSMPIPRANTGVINTRPGVFNPSKLNLL